MPELEPPTDFRSGENARGSRKFQFSLLWLLVTVTIVAIVLGLGASLGEFLSDVLYLSVCCVVPTPLIICVVFANGHTRAFAIGALVPWLMVLPWSPDRASVLFLILTLILSAVCGVLAVAAWRWIRRGPSV